MTTETVAEKFWRESHEKRERREEIEALPPGVARFEAILQDVWTTDKALFDSQPLLLRKREPTDYLDEWLAEDNPYRMPEVLEALGLR